MPISQKVINENELLFTAEAYLQSKNIRFEVPQTLLMLPAADLGAGLGGLSKKTYKLIGDIEIISDDLALMHNFALGAPLCVLLAELTAVLGAKKFFLAGSAGALAEGLSFGDRVLCRGAYSEEGTSRHYAGGNYFPACGFDGISSLPVKAAGDSWTTDAFFRETKASVQAYREKGCLTVEMEASALFAFAKSRGFEAGAAFVISDLLYGGIWRPAQKNAQTLKALRALVTDLIKIL